METKFYCNKCGYKTNDSIHYCPNCSAEMIYAYEDKYIACSGCSDVFVFSTQDQLEQLKNKGKVTLPTLCQSCKIKEYRKKREKIEKSKKKN